MVLREAARRGTEAVVYDRGYGARQGCGKEIYRHEYPNLAPADAVSAVSGLVCRHCATARTTNHKKEKT